MPVEATPITLMRRKRKDLAVALAEAEVGSAREASLMKKVDQITEIIARMMRENGKLPLNPGENVHPSKKKARGRLIT